MISTIEKKNVPRNLPIIYLSSRFKGFHAAAPRFRGFKSFKGFKGFKSFRGFSISSPSSTTSPTSLPLKQYRRAIKQRSGETARRAMKLFNC